jgi:uncharacterized protein with gpF-like domain
MPLKLSPTQVSFNTRGDGKFNKPFQDQLDFFRQKINLPSEHYDDIIKSAHDHAFIVAGATKADLLNDLRMAVDKAISDGKSIQWFRKEFSAIVQKHGWEGWTGSDTAAGRDWRTRVIYNTNLSASYAAGRYAQLTDPDRLQSRPYWKYVHNDTVRHPRPLHQSWSGMVLRYDDPFWQTHFPPNGWGCRCRITAVPASEYHGEVGPTGDTYSYIDKDGKKHTVPSTKIYKDRYGNEHVLPVGIDYGWDYPPGASIHQRMQGFIDNKAASLPAPLATAFKAEVSGTLEAARDYVLTNGLENAHNKIEFAYVYDDVGNILVKKRGGKSSVSFTDAEMTSMKDAQGVVLAHNHPGGRSLSKEDWVLANVIDAQIYAMGHNGVEYSGSMLDIKRFQDLYSHVDGVLKHYFMPLIRADKLTSAEADLFHAHLVNSVLKASAVITYDVNGALELPPMVEMTLTKLLEHFK